MFPTMSIPQMQANGTPCSADAQCSSGYCGFVDGTCRSPPAGGDAEVIRLVVSTTSTTPLTSTEINYLWALVVNVASGTSYVEVIAGTDISGFAQLTMNIYVDPGNRPILGVIFNAIISSNLATSMPGVVPSASPGAPFSVDVPAACSTNSACGTGACGKCVNFFYFCSTDAHCHSNYCSTYFDSCRPAPSLGTIEVGTLQFYPTSSPPSQPLTYAEFASLHSLLTSGSPSASYVQLLYGGVGSPIAALYYPATRADLVAIRVETNSALFISSIHTALGFSQTIYANAVDYWTQCATMATCGHSVGCGDCINGWACTNNYNCYSDYCGTFNGTCRLPPSAGTIEVVRLTVSTLSPAPLSYAELSTVRDALTAATNDASYVEVIDGTDGPNAALTVNYYATANEQIGPINQDIAASTLFTQITALFPGATVSPTSSLDIPSSCTTASTCGNPGCGLCFNGGVCSSDDECFSGYCGFFNSQCRTAPAGGTVETVRVIINTSTPYPLNSARFAVWRLVLERSTDDASYVDIIESDVGGVSHVNATFYAPSNDKIGDIKSEILASNISIAFVAANVGAPASVDVASACSSASSCGTSGCGRCLDTTLCSPN